MNIAKPDMWGKYRFKLATTPPVVRKSLKGIDRQLELWDSNHGNHQSSTFYLATVIRVCQEWEAAKAVKIANNPTKNVLERLAKVRLLKQMAFERLRWEAFEMTKEGGGKGVAAALAPGYSSERTQFLAGKATGVATNKGGEFNPKGGSFVAESKSNMLAVYAAAVPPELLATMNKPFPALTEAEFETLHDYFAGRGAEYAGMQTKNVHFARKDERIQHNMLVPINGVYHRNEGDIPYNTAGLDIYAMDQYGNLMVQSSNAFHGKGHGAMQYNHSSLNAGNKVICAGTCRIAAGVIQEIDNDSGHYKPGRAQMHALIKVLIDDDRTNLTFATVKLNTAAGPQFFRGHAIASFYANFSYVGAPV